MVGHLKNFGYRLKLHKESLSTALSIGKNINIFENLPEFSLWEEKNVRGKLFIYFITNSFFPIYPCALNYIRGKGAFNILNYVSKGAF